MSECVSVITLSSSVSTTQIGAVTPANVVHATVLKEQAVYVSSQLNTDTRKWKEMHILYRLSN